MLSIIPSFNSYKLFCKQPNGDPQIEFRVEEYNFKAVVSLLSTQWA